MKRPGEIPGLFFIYRSSIFLNSKTIQFIVRKPVYKIKLQFKIAHLIFVFLYALNK